MRIPAKISPPKQMTAPAYIAKGLLAEGALQENGPLGKEHIAHHVLEFEIASQDGKQVIQRGTVDVWKSPDQNRLAMPLLLRMASFRPESGKLPMSLPTSSDWSSLLLLGIGAV